VNSPTISFTTPAAAPRTGWGESALPPPDRGTKIQLPFAALPHDLRKDPRLKGNRTAIVLAAALLEYAPGVKPSCYPTNTRLAADLGCCEQTVRTALAALQAAGWIKIVRGSNQPNGRRIWLTWRMDGCTVPALRQVLDTPQPVGPLPQPAGPPLKPTGPEEEIVIEEEIEEESRQFARAIERPRGEPKPASLAAPAQPPAPERAAEPTIMPPPLAPLAPVQALPPLAEAGPREARPAIPVTPAGPTPQSAPGPVPGGVAAPAGVNQCPDPVGEPHTRLARTQSELHPEQGPPALVAAPDAPRGLANPRPLEPSPATPVPAPSPTTAGPALPLTAEQRARLDALPAATRDLVLTWLLTGDPILVAEAKKKLVPPPRRPEAPRSVRETLERIREDPSYPALAASGLASLWSDQRSYSGFKARMEDAWRGDIPVTRLLAAFEQATGPKVRNPGALFNHCLIHQRE
jgi:hypothetical protein